MAVMSLTEWDPLPWLHQRASIRELIGNLEPYQASELDLSGGSEIDTAGSCLWANHDIQDGPGVAVAAELAVP